MKKSVIIRIAVTVFLLFGVESCYMFGSLATRTDTPCFRLDDEEMKKECYQWRMNYPKEYNKFYDNVKRIHGDTSKYFLALPDRVQYIIRKDKVILLK